MAKNILNLDRREKLVLYLGRLKSNREETNMDKKLTPYYYGYKKYLSTLAPYIKASKDSLICITDDFGLQMISFLREKGYQNFTILLTDEDPDINKKSVYYISKYFPNELNGVNILTLEECKGMKFDLIISNPPYQIGNDITRNIIENINFNQFINLMPLSNYKKGGLFKYIKEKFQGVYASMEDSFDACVAPDVCALSKNPTEYESYSQFELKFYYDKRLSKFWEENASRKQTFLEHIYICVPKMFNSFNSKTSFACGIYTPHDKVHSINHLINKFSSKDSIEAFINSPNKKLTRDCSEEYVWNICKPDCTVDKCFVKVSSGNINQIFTVFASEKEKDNFAKWWYSAERNGKNPKSGLTSILLAGLNKPTGCPFDLAIPNVDWTRSWTDEEILKDYGYSDSEIKEILALGQNDLYRHALLDY